MTPVLQPLHDLCVSLAHRVCPLYRTDAKGRHHLVGTGTLFGGARAGFILTAAHVMDEFDDAQVVIGGSRGLLRVARVGIGYEYRPQQTVDADVAAMPLPAVATVELADHYRFTLTEELGDTRPSDRFTFYAFVGYPWSKNRPVGPTMDLSAQAHYFMGQTLLDITRLRTAGKTPATHFALAADKKHFMDVSLRPVNIFKAQGMSGCGVWRIDIDRNTGRISEPLLVGIGIEHLERQNALVATRISLARELVQEIEERLSSQ